MLLALGLALAAPAMDWTTAGDELARVLSGYLRVDTVNPPGNEAAGVAYLRRVLEPEGIPVEVIDHGEGRASLVARVKGAGTEPPLCLLSHIDVVASEPEFWPAHRPPLGGTVADGYVFGRGALDMKGMGALEAMTLVWLQRNRVALRRDVILLAVADEEVGNRGAKALVERWDQIGCADVINEGGLGLKDVFFEGQTVFAISVAEKGVLWLRMIASGPAGHGSRPDPSQAPAVLTRALARIEAMPKRPKVDEAVWGLLDAVGAGRRGLERLVLRSRPLARLAVIPRLMGVSGTRAVLTDTVNITGVGGNGGSTNVLPSEAWATLDCRLLPGTTPESVVDRLRALVDDPAIRFEVEDAEPANASPMDTPLFRALARHAVGERTDAVAGPVLSVGFTDSIYLRPLGVNAYGFVPFELTQAEAETMHGHGERVSVQNLRDGLRILYGAVVEVAGEGSGPP